MRIAYFLEYDVYVNSGVLKKVAYQAETWSDFGHEVKLFIVSPPRKRIEPKYAGYSDKRLILLPDGILKNYLNKILVTSKILMDIKVFAPHMIYYRQGIWYPGLLRILGYTKSIMELNSMDLEEIRNQSALKNLIYRLGRKRILNKVDALIATSFEIMSNYRILGKPMITISNGFLENISPELKSIGNRKRPNIELIFVGTDGQAWQGVDKVCKMAELFPKYHFHIVGNDQTPLANRENITYYGVLDPPGLQELYSNVDIGIGTLALHRKGMREASPLKVREYILYGLPVIVGYVDTDLADSDFVLTLENTQENINPNVDRIRHFCEIWKGRRVDPTTVHSLNPKQKEAQRLNFFEDVVKGTIHANQLQ